MYGVVYDNVLLLKELYDIEERLTDRRSDTSLHTCGDLTVKSLQDSAEARCK